MTLSRLKKSVEQIYMGSLVVYGDPSVKPHDRISINDGPSSMTGQAKVREVVHTLSVQSGLLRQLHQTRLSIRLMIRLLELLILLFYPLYLDIQYML